MNELEMFRTTTPLPTPSRDLVTTGAEDLTLQAMLFKALHGLSKQTKGTLMLYNLQTAAFHLSFMLKGYTTSDKMVSLAFWGKNHYWSSPQAVPNIPDSCEAFYDA